MKRNRILEAAAKLFFERGYLATSVESLATELGVTKPFIYSYFKNKRAVLEAMHLHSAERVLEYVETARSRNVSPDRALAEFIRLFVGENIRNQVLSSVYLQEEKYVSEETLAAVKVIERLVHEQLTDLIREGQASGIFHVSDPSLASLSISGMVRWVHRWYREDGRKSPEAIAEELTNLGLNMVGFDRERPS